MNIKKIITKLLIRLFIVFSAFVLIFFLWTLFIFSGGIDPKMPIPAEVLMNKSKEEVIEICFAKEAPRSIDGKRVYIYILKKRTNTGVYGTLIVPLKTLTMQ